MKATCKLTLIVVIPALLVLGGYQAPIATADEPTAGAEPAKVSSRHCELRGSKTLFHTRRARVFKRTRPVKNSGGDTVTTYYGCLYTVGRRRVLGFDGWNDDDGYSYTAEPHALRGPYVAYSSGHFGETKEFSSLDVVDLRSGRIVFSFADGFPHDLVLHQTGALAWTTKTCVAEDDGIFEPLLPGGPTFPSSRCRYVLAHDQTGTRALDADLAIHLRSLSIRGSTVFWQTGTTKKAAPLAE